MAKKKIIKLSLMALVVGFGFVGMGCASFFGVFDQHTIKGFTLYKTKSTVKEDIRGNMTLTNILMFYGGTEPVIKIALSKISQNDALQFSFIIDSVSTNVGYYNLNSLLVKIDDKQPVTLVDNNTSKNTVALQTRVGQNIVTNYKYKEFVTLTLSADMAKALRSCKTLTLQVGNLGAPLSIPEKGLLEMKAFMDK